jgi:NTE family protein
VPIDRYASESVELLKDIDARWTALRQIRRSGCSVSGTSPLASVLNAPDADIHAIDVSFRALQDHSERDHLNQLPTSFVLPAGEVDRLRAAAATIVFGSQELREVLREEGARILDDPGPARPAAPPTRQP